MAVVSMKKTVCDKVIEKTLRIISFISDNPLCNVYEIRDSLLDGNDVKDFYKRFIVPLIRYGIVLRVYFDEKSNKKYKCRYFINPRKFYFSDNPRGGFVCPEALQENKEMFFVEQFSEPSKIEFRGKKIVTEGGEDIFYLLVMMASMKPDKRLLDMLLISPYEIDVLFSKGISEGITPEEERREIMYDVFSNNALKLRRISVALSDKTTKIIKQRLKDELGEDIDDDELGEEYCKWLSNKAKLKPIITSIEINELGRRLGLIPSKLAKMGKKAIEILNLRDVVVEY